MPQRTNEFQQLVTRIYRLLVGAGARVTESAILTKVLAGHARQREVDVVIDASLGGHDVRLAIHCRDRTRPQTVEWIEELIGKKAANQADRVIAVSRAGFTEQARDLARANRIDTMTLAEADAADWNRFFGPAIAAFRFVISGLTPTEVHLGLGDETSREVLAGLETTAVTVHGPDGASIGTLQEVFERLVSDSDLSRAMVADLPPNSSGTSEIRLDLPPGSYVSCDRAARSDVTYLLFKASVRREASVATTRLRAYRSAADGQAATLAVTGQFETATWHGDVVIADDREETLAADMVLRDRQSAETIRQPGRIRRPPPEPPDSL